MRFAIAALLLVSSPALAQAPRGMDPSIRQCDRISVAYRDWVLNFRDLLERNSSDRGGRVDQSLIAYDFNFALVSAGEFVHRGIQMAQRADITPELRVRTCKAITADARDQIETYMGRLLSELHPTDRRGRLALREEFRLGLQESTSLLRGD